MGTQLPPKGAQPPIFGPCLLWPNGWMDQDAIWYEGRPGPRPHYVRCGPTSPQKKRRHSPHIVLDGYPAPPQKGAQPPNFRPMFVAKRLPISPITEQLYKLLLGDSRHEERGVPVGERSVSKHSACVSSSHAAMTRKRHQCRPTSLTAPSFQRSCYLITLLTSLINRHR